MVHMMSKTIEISRKLAEWFLQNGLTICFETDPHIQELRAILAAPSIDRQEPVAWLVQCKKSGLVEQAEPSEEASNPEYWTDAFPVYTSPSAPVPAWTTDDIATADADGLRNGRASVVMPEKRTNFDYRELGDDGYIAAKEWNAAIDKFKELNK